MRERAIGRLAQAIRGSGHSIVREEVKESQRAVILTVSPLTAELTGSRVVLEDDDLTFTAQVRKYEQDFGFTVGDTLAVIPVKGDEWVVTGVISTKDNFEGPDTVTVPAAGRTFASGTGVTSTPITAVVPYRDANGNIIGYLPLIA
jgi:hypothetical protein